jgi:hypothetical protein
VSRRLLVVLIVLGVLAMGVGVAGGLLLAREPGGEPAVAGPTTIPETTVTPTSEPASSTSSTSSSSTTSTTTGLRVQARVAERLEDGVVVRYEASEPISAALQWGFGGPSGHQLQFPGPAAQGSIKLALARTTRPVSMRVTGQSADGRTGSSDILSARRLLRPFAVPSTVLGAGERSGPLALRFFHQVRQDPTRTRVVNLTVPFPRSGQSTMNRNVSAIGLTAHLGLRVTVTVS